MFDASPKRAAVRPARPAQPAPLDRVGTPQAPPPRTAAQGQRDTPSPGSGAAGAPGDAGSPLGSAGSLRRVAGAAHSFGRISVYPDRGRGGADGGGAAGEGRSQEAQGLAQVQRVIAGEDGRPLGPAHAAFAGRRLGGGAEQARVHDGAGAQRAAALLGAKGIAVGSHILLGSGYADPASARGAGVLLHELAHVAQAGGAEPLPGQALSVGAADSAAEGEARRAAGSEAPRIGVRTAPGVAHLDRASSPDAIDAGILDAASPLGQLHDVFQSPAAHRDFDDIHCDSDLTLGMGNFAGDTLPELITALLADERAGQVFVEALASYFSEEPGRQAAWAVLVADANMLAPASVGAACTAENIRAAIQSTLGNRAWTLLWHDHAEAGGAAANVVYDNPTGEWRQGYALYSNDRDGTNLRVSRPGEPDAPLDRLDEDADRIPNGDPLIELGGVEDRTWVRIPRSGVPEPTTEAMVRVKWRGDERYAGADSAHVGGEMWAPRRFIAGQWMFDREGLLGALMEEAVARFQVEYWRDHTVKEGEAGAAALGVSTTGGIASQVSARSSGVERDRAALDGYLESLGDSLDFDSFPDTITKSVSTEVMTSDGYLEDWRALVVWMNYWYQKRQAHEDADVRDRMGEIWTRWYADSWGALPSSPAALPTVHLGHAMILSDAHALTSDVLRPEGESALSAESGGQRPAETTAAAVTEPAQPQDFYALRAVGVGSPDGGAAVPLVVVPGNIDWARSLVAFLVLTPSVESATTEVYALLGGAGRNAIAILIEAGEARPFRVEASDYVEDALRALGRSAGVPDSVTVGRTVLVGVGDSAPHAALAEGSGEATPGGEDRLAGPGDLRGCVDIERVRAASAGGSDIVLIDAFGDPARSRLVRAALDERIAAQGAALLALATFEERVAFLAATPAVVFQWTSRREREAGAAAADQIFRDIECAVGQLATDGTADVLDDPLFLPFLQRYQGMQGGFGRAGGEALTELLAGEEAAGTGSWVPEAPDTSGPDTTRVFGAQSEAQLPPGREGNASAVRHRAAEAPVAAELEAAVAQIDQLPQVVKDQLGPGADDERAVRERFLERGRAFFGSYEATLAHYGAIVPMGELGEVHVHETFLARLRAAAAAIRPQEAPTTRVGYTARGVLGASALSYEHCHALGLAVDYRATDNPHIEQREIAELIQIVTREENSLQLGEDATARRARIRRMGDTSSSELLGDEETIAFLAGVIEEADRLAAASQRFQDSLAHAADFLDARSRYLYAEAAGDTAQMGIILSEVAGYIAPWRADVERQLASSEADARALGIDPAEVAQVPTGEVEDWASQRSEEADAAGDSASFAQVILTLRTRQSLQGLLSDPRFLFGSLKDGRVHDTVGSPSAAQLVARGYFNMDDAFNGVFLAALVRQGFDIGVAWQDEGTDAMHVELVVD